MHYSLLEELQSLQKQTEEKRSVLRGKEGFWQEGIFDMRNKEKVW